MDATWIVVAVTFGLWLVAVAFQLSDLCAGWFDVLGARDRGVPGRLSRARASQLFWMPPVLSIAFLALVVGVDWAGRLAFDDGLRWAGVLVLLALLVAMMAILLGSVAILQRRSVPPYALLRHDLRELQGTRLSRDDALHLRRELELIDEREGAIRLVARKRSHRERSRRADSGLPDVRAKLETLAKVLRADASVDSAFVRSVPWGSAFSFLVRASAWRLLPTAFGLAALAAVVVASIGTAGWGALGVIAVLLPVVSFLLGVACARFSLAAKAAWHAVYQEQRAEAVQLLEALEQRAARGVPGLSERVSRALRILRERAD